MTDVAVRSEAARPDSDFLLEHRPFVLKLCRILLRDADESDDAAQQVFLNAYCAIGAGVRPLNVRAWLAQIARNECRSRARRAAAHPAAPLPEALADDRLDPADAAAQRVLVRRLRDELAALPDRQREAVLLREFRGLSYTELAAAMDETGAAVESLLQRARRRLATRLEEVRRPLVGVPFAVDWVRNAVSRVWPGPAATEAVATGGAVAVAAKLAAAGVVAVGVGVASGDLHRAPPSPSGPPGAQSRPSPHGSVGSRPARRPGGVVTSEPRGRGGSHQGPGTGRRGDGRREDVSSGSGPGPSSGPGSSERSTEPVGAGVEPSPPAPGGGGASGSSGPGSTGSGLPDEGSRSSSSGPGSGIQPTSSSGPGSGAEPTSSSGPPDSSGSNGSGSGSSGSDSGATGSGSSGPGSGSPDSGSSGSDGGSGSSGHDGSGSSGSGSGD